MYRFAVIAALILLSFVAISAQTVRAEEVRVSYPFMAGSLHEGPLDMVYYIDPTKELRRNPASAYHVYATFVDRELQGTPVRHRLILTDGDEATVVVEGYPDIVYRFWRVAHRAYASVGVLGSDKMAASE
ncbi:MAG: hypothetical protein AAGD47_04880 [Pseudomonadota bacterium]